MAGQISGSELQTLISTLQNGNTQLGHVFQALGGVRDTIAAQTAQLSAVAQAATASRLGPIATPARPPAFEGYVSVDIPGVGPRLIPYYSEG
jgi:hypothetical protein